MKLFLERLLYFWAGITIIGLAVAVLYWAIKIVLYIAFISLFIAIAATTFYPTIKYWETSASGCLTFMEISEKNNGKYLGYKDGTNAIFITENNYKEKFEEYLTDIMNPKWEQIAQEGTKYTMKKFSNDEAVKELVSLMEDLL